MYTKEEIKKYLEDILKTSIFRCSSIINNMVIYFDEYRFAETYNKETILYLLNNNTLIAEMNIENITSII